MFEVNNGKSCTVVQLECARSWVIFGSISAAPPWAGRFLTHPALSTSRTGSSGCSHSCVGVKRLSTKNLLC